MSKYIFIIIVFALSFSCAVKATSENKQIKDEVLESFKSLVDASKKLDSALYFQHFDSDKFVGLNADGTNWNSIDELTPLIISGFNAIEKVTHLKFNNVNISIIDNFTAILVNEYVQSMILKMGSKSTL
ncbi:hypothetical protein [Alteromonas lipotrueae]|uniref:hypothetical protein n=1 Tax=Alteromonas lipotrueae TaxID=2803814 RepID=UPI001C487146|nr:hypothetical protein [Alteromonas lipotrueae]